MPDRLGFDNPLLLFSARPPLFCPMPVLRHLPANDASNDLRFNAAYRYPRTLTNS